MTQSFPLYGYLAGILAQGHAVERLNHLLGEMAASVVDMAETELLAMCLLRPWLSGYSCLNIIVFQQPGPCLALAAIFGQICTSHSFYDLSF